MQVITCGFGLLKQLVELHLYEKHHVVVILVQVYKFY